MLKATMNEARLRLDITTLGPLMVKTGYATVVGADMAPVQTFRNGQSEVYIPGSTLKGIFRSHLEKVINSIKPRTACNPLMSSGDVRDNRNLYLESCGSRFLQRRRPSDPPMPPHEVYAKSCPTCRLFGSTSFGSRIAIEDAYLAEDSVGRKELIEHRDGIAIDRLTGGTGGGAKFDLEVVTEGTTFTTAIHLRNFEIWQLGMLFVIIQDMQDELIRIGSGRSRGLGTVRAEICTQASGTHEGGVTLSSVRFRQAIEPDDKIWGLGHWLGSERGVYGIQETDVLSLPFTMPHTPHNVRNIRVFKNDELEFLQKESSNIFAQRMQAWTPITQSAVQQTQQGS